MFGDPRGAPDNRFRASILGLAAALVACQRVPERTPLRRLGPVQGQTHAVVPRYLPNTSRISAAAARPGGHVALTGARMVTVSRDGGKTWTTHGTPVLDAPGLRLSPQGDQLYLYGTE